MKKQHRIALSAAICGVGAWCGLGFGGSAEAQEPYQVAQASQPFLSPTPSLESSLPNSQSVGSGLALVGYQDGESGDCGCGDSCHGGCQTSCADESSCEDRGGLFHIDGLLSDCELGDPISVLGNIGGISAGGWIQLGYHSNNLSLFNSRQNDFQLQQGWLYFEKALDTSQGFDFGGRIDYLYGTDGPDTQAFGIANNSFDNQFDNGGDYGHALPQVYGEVGFGDLSAKFGHFYTIVGYEVVAATGNFFYSHAYTTFNSEPFTHTGALFTYGASEDVELYGGYVLGWDSGFEDNGDAFLGGSSVQLTEDINVISTVVAGRFNDANANRDLGNGNFGVVENGFMSSTVATVQLTEDLQYVFQSDVLDTEDDNGNTVRDTFGINQYLLKQVTDCVGLGVRFEWWNVDADSSGFYGDAAPANLNLNGDFDIFALTLGMNVKPHANVTIRPEIRWDWVDGSNTDLASADFIILENNQERQTTFGVDTIFVF